MTQIQTQKQEQEKIHDFDELFFEKGCDIDAILSQFFIKNNEICGNTEYIIYKIKKRITYDRNILMNLNGDGTDLLNRVGKVSYIKHYVIPEQNNGKEYYVYAINSFI